MGAFDRSAIVSKLAGLLEQLELRNQDGGGAARDGDDPKPVEEAKPKPAGKPVEAKEAILPAGGLEQFFSALLDLIGRTNRENGKPCCENMVAPSVSDISAERKLPNGTFEAPANGVFDENDTIKIDCRIIACPPLDIRIDLTEQEEDDGDRIHSADNVGRGGDLKPDPQFPNDPGTHRYGTEVDLSKTSFSVAQSPARIRLSISVRDVCRRVATGATTLTFVDFK